MELEVNLNVAEGEIFPFQMSRIDDKGDVVWDDPVLDPETKKPFAKVGIRSMGPFWDERIAKRKQLVEHVFNPKNRGMQRNPYLQELSPEESLKERDDAYDYAITFLEGFKDKGTGAIITCTRENKLALMRVDVFRRFFEKCQTDLGNIGVAAKEELAKNLSTTSSLETSADPA